MTSVQQVAEYYSLRAPEYETTADYVCPENAAVTARLRAAYQVALRGRDVLEIACGPGYWSEAIALTARSLLSTDQDAALVKMVQQRLAKFTNVRCQVTDAYTLDGISGHFNAAFAQFWWSHIPKSKLRSFLTNLHSKLLPGSLVMFMDTLPYGLNGRRIDDAGDVLEPRVLLDGRKFEIIKNFPSESEVTEALAGISEQMIYKQSRAEGYWAVTYRTGS